VFGWLRWHKPIVYIGTGGVTYNRDRVKVVDERNTAAKTTTATSCYGDHLWSNIYANWWKKQGEANLEKMVAQLHPVNDYASKLMGTAPPETVESVLSKFDDAGADRPKVVITGDKGARGREWWWGKIDDGVVAGSSSLATCEKDVISHLNNRLDYTVVETTTITYE
jgi:hypothetical protein